MALLSHYYQPDLQDGIDELSVANWLDVLGDLPQQAVDDAIGEWLREETKRPTPADIRIRAKRRLSRPVVAGGDDAPFGPFAPVEMTPEELAMRKRVSDELTNVYKFLRKIPKVSEG